MLSGFLQFQSDAAFQELFLFGIEGASIHTGTNMLKVTIVEERSQRRLILEGALVEPWVEELEKTWAAAVSESPARRLIIDLTNVTTISNEAEAVLSDLARHGARFLCAGVYTKYQLKQITRRSQLKLGDRKSQSSSND